MKLVYFLTVALIIGILFSQIFDLEFIQTHLVIGTDILLGYIMMEVGRDFVFDKKHYRSYIQDFTVATIAAIIPWILCFIYLWIVFYPLWKPTLFLSLFAAPTSSGILFTMLVSAGVGTTWCYKKIKHIAVFDDLDTILLLIPLQFLFHGSFVTLATVVICLIILCVIAVVYFHRLHLKSEGPYLLVYAVALTALLGASHRFFHVDLEILLFAFIFGMLLAKSHAKPTKNEVRLDRVLKVVFMLCVGLIFPKTRLTQFSYSEIILHVCVITVLSSVGKFVAFFFYKKHASFQERMALCIALLPRGELSAGIIAIGIIFKMPPAIIAITGLSLAVNLCFKGVLIKGVATILKKKA